MCDIPWQSEAAPVRDSPPCREGNAVLVRSGGRRSESQGETVALGTGARMLRRGRFRFRGANCPDRLQSSQAPERNLGPQTLGLPGTPMRDLWPETAELTSCFSRQLSGDRPVLSPSLPPFPPSFHKSGVCIHYLLEVALGDPFWNILSYPHTHTKQSRCGNLNFCHSLLLCHQVTPPFAFSLILNSHQIPGNSSSPWCTRNPLPSCSPDLLVEKSSFLVGFLGAEQTFWNVPVPTALFLPDSSEFLQEAPCLSAHAPLNTASPGLSASLPVLSACHTLSASTMVGGLSLGKTAKQDQHPVGRGQLWISGHRWRTADCCWENSRGQASSGLGSSPGTARGSGSSLGMSRTQRLRSLTSIMPGSQSCSEVQRTPICQPPAQLCCPQPPALTSVRGGDGSCWAPRTPSYPVA